MGRRGCIVVICLVLMAAGGVRAEDGDAHGDEDGHDHGADGDDHDGVPAGEAFAERFAGTYVLLEHAGSVGNAGDLSPGATFALTQSVLGGVGFEAHEDISLSLDLGVVTELTRTDTTYANEPMLTDLELSIDLRVPLPDSVNEIVGIGGGLTLITPTSKASQANSLIMGLEVGAAFSITAPLLDGLTFSYSGGVIPRLHRYTTASTLTPYPCSPANGCSLGGHTETGVRNTAFQVHAGTDITLSAFKDVLSISAGMEAWWGWLYDLSPSPNYSEETLANAGNKGGSPATVSTQFVASVGVQPHPGFGLAIGLWTPGGMNTLGGYYNPFGNRFSTVFLDFTFTPVAGVLHDAKKRRAAKGER